MNALYLDGYRPTLLPKRYEAESLVTTGKGQAGDILRRYGAPADYGDPIEAVGYFETDERQTMKAIVGDYENGRRVEVRLNRAAFRISIYTPERKEDHGNSPDHA